MSTCTRCVTFAHPFELNGRILPPGDYRVVTDEELIECLSFPVYRRVATMIFVPVALRHTSSIDMVVIDPRDLRVAQFQDRAAHQTPEIKADVACQTAIGIRVGVLTPRAETRVMTEKTIYLTSIVGWRLRRPPIFVGC